MGDFVDAQKADNIDKLSMTNQILIYVGLYEGRTKMLEIQNRKHARCTAYSKG